MCAMIETYDYPVFFFMLFSFPYYFSIQLFIMHANFDFLFTFRFFILKIYGSLLKIDQLYAICR